MSVDNNKKALKSGIWYTVSNLLVRSIGFITTPIFTRILTKEQFGAYNNYTSWLNIVLIFVTLNLESTLISARFDYKKKFDEYILSMISLSTLSGIIWFVFINVLNKQIESFLGMPLLYINAMVIYLIALPAVNMFQARERYYYEYKKTVITSIILSFGTAILSVLLVVCMNNKLTGRILGSIIPTIILGLLFYVFFIKKGKKINIKYWLYALPICLPYIPHLLSMTLLNSTDRIMIEKWCGSEDTALYSLAYNCGALVTLLLNSLNSAYSPWIGEKLNEYKISEIRRFSKKYISGFVFLAIGLMLIAPEVLLILGGRSYLNAKYVMTPVAMGCVCQFLYTLFVNIEQFKKKTIGMACASVIAAIVNLILNWLCIPQFGYLAAAYTTLIGYICLLVMHMYLVYRMKLNNAYSYSFIIRVVIICLIIMIGITFSYKINVIRYFIIVVYAIIAIVILLKYKHTFFKFMKRA